MNKWQRALLLSSLDNFNSRGGFNHQMSQVFLNLNNQQAGPYSVEAVNQMLSSNQVSPETLGWMQGMANWEALHEDTFANLGLGLTSQPKVPTSWSEPKPSLTSRMPQEQVKQIDDTPIHSKKNNSGTINISQALGEAFTFYKNNALCSTAWLIIVGLIGGIPVVNLMIPLLGVNFYTCVRNFRTNGKKMAFGELFDFSYAVGKIIGPIFVGILILIGYLCFIIPGVILTCMWAYTPCLQGDKPGLSLFKAMKESKRLAKGNYFKIILLIIILALLAFSGFLLLGIGVLITVPIAHVALYCAYDQCKS